MGSLTDAILSGTRGLKKNVTELATALEFIEAPWGLNTELYPVQKVIIKAFYGLPLDTVRKFDVKDWRGNLIRSFTEEEYLQYLYDEKRCNVRVSDPSRQFREMVLSVGRRSGKCVIGDTLVLTDRGIYPIRDLGDPNGPETQPLDCGVVQESNRPSRSAYFYNGGVRETFRIHSSCGVRIEGTGNHRVRVMTPEGVVDWKRLDEIRDGDWIAVSRGANLWSKDYVEIPVDGSDKPIRFSEFLAYTCGHALSGHGISPAFSDKFPGLFFRAGYEPEGGTPWAVLRSPVSVVRKYLEGLFEGRMGRWGSTRTLALYLTSDRLARETQLLLLNLGITSHLIGATLRVDDTRSRKRFFREFEGLESRITWDIESSEDDSDFVPYQDQWVAKFPYAARNSIRKGTRITYGRLRSVYRKALLSGSDVPREVQNHIPELIEKDYHYSQVLFVEKGEAPVYDLNVPDGESFVANGVTNHNTTISACISAYETYKLINLGDPQRYYGLPASNTIQLISVATDRDQAGLLYQEVSGHFSKCAFFAPYTANNTQAYARFQSPKDIERYGSFSENMNAKATLKVTFRSCIAKGLRGAGNILVILDEVAHFTDSGQSSADEVYKAVVPSRAAFTPKDLNNKLIKLSETSDGRAILISSPLGKTGLFYRQFQLGMAGAKDIFCVQAPTWEVNPTVGTDYFEAEYRKDPNSFFIEFGAEFSDRFRNWIEDRKDLDAIIDPDLRPVYRGVPRQAYYLGLDIALKGDGCAAAIGHVDGAGHVVLDAIEEMKAGEGRYKDVDRLEFDAVADWVADICSRFYVAEGIFDQWVGIPFEQALQKRGITQVKSKHFRPELSSEVFQNFKNMMWDRRVKLPDYPKVPGEAHSALILELQELQAEQKSKYITLVEKAAGKHDDRSDALVRMVWLAGPKAATGPHFPSGRIAGARPVADPMLALRRKGFLSGSHESRQIPRKNRWGR